MPECAKAPRVRGAGFMGPCSRAYRTSATCWSKRFRLTDACAAGPHDVSEPRVPSCAAVREFMAPSLSLPCLMMGRTVKAFTAIRAGPIDPTSLRKMRWTHCGARTATMDKAKIRSS